MAELTWPADLGHGTFTGRFGFMDADSHDPDREPEITSATGGTVTITPSARSVRYGGAQGPMILAARPAKGVIDAEGYLCTATADGGAGGRGMVFPATDDTDLTPTDWTYEVSIILDGQVRIPSFNVKLPTGATVDLSLAVPVPSSGGTAVVVDTTTAERAEAAAAQAEATVAGIDQAISEYVAATPDLQGEPGASVTGGRDNGDGTVSFELSDGTYTDPVTVPPGPAGRGIASISDPDSDSRVTITFTDDTTATVQAIRGADGHSPVVTWDGTTIVTDGTPGPDLKGEPGEPGDPGPPGQVLTPESMVVVGPGRPDAPTTTGMTSAALAALPVGCEYRSTDGASVGAWVWRKRPTGWVVTQGDTGWLALTPDEGVMLDYLRMRRDGNRVTFGFKLADASAGGKFIYTLPVGFRVGESGWYTTTPMIPIYRGGTKTLIAGWRVTLNKVWVGDGTPSGECMTEWSWITDDAWPTTLPTI